MRSNSLFQLLPVIALTLFFHNSDISAAGDSGDRLFYVSAGGSDSNPGSASQPLATAEAARDMARRAGPGNHRIIFLPGEYFLAKPIELDPSDNGLTLEAGKGGKVSLYGGTPVTGWKRDGNRFWYAELPGVKEGSWDFRALVINGRMAQRARYPDTATFLHRQAWDVRVLPAIAGYWERQPLPEELVTMAYDPADIPPPFDIKNAELRIYHMWNESLVGISKNDTKNHIFTLASPAIYPPGAFGVKKYIILNTREGMTKPGQWYLDRTAGRVVYWPLEDEDMQKSRVFAPRMEEIIRIMGSKEKKAEKITLRGLSLQVTTIPLKPAGWAAASFNGAVHMENATECALDGLEIFNVGGLGISALQMNKLRVTGCDIHHTGGCGFRFAGSDRYIAGNSIHNIGIYYPSASAMYSTGERLHIYRNEIFNGPYSGIIFSGPEILVEENHIYRVMQELHDGAAIYSGGFATKKSILRGNLVRDIVASGKGFGVSAYYFDEGAGDCLAERNVAIGVGRPTHNHITLRTVYRDNVFISEGDMVISFQRSAGCTFERNTLVAPGKINIVQPNGIKTWKNNVIYRNGSITDGFLKGFTIDSVMPSYNIPARRTQPAKAVRVGKTPVLDGTIELSEWPGTFHQLDREPSRMPVSGAPVLVKFSYDNKYIYIGAMITMFDPTRISKGPEWEKNDGFEVILAGKASDKSSAVKAIRVFADGTVKGDGNAGAKELQYLKDVRAVTRILDQQKRGGGWHCEMAIPLKALGIKPAAGISIPFNMSAFVNEYDGWHCWEGMGEDSRDISGAGMLQFQ